MRTLKEAPVTSKRKQLSHDHYKLISWSEKIDQVTCSNSLVRKKNHIQNLVRGKTRDGPKKTQLTTEMDLLKPKVEQNSQETIAIYNNSDCVHQFTFLESRMTIFIV